MSAYIIKPGYNWLMPVLSSNTLIEEPLPDLAVRVPWKMFDVEASNLLDEAEQ